MGCMYIVLYIAICNHFPPIFIQIIGVFRACFMLYPRPGYMGRQGGSGDIPPTTLEHKRGMHACIPKDMIY